MYAGNVTCDNLTVCTGTPASVTSGRFLNDFGSMGGEFRAEQPSVRR